MTSSMSSSPTHHHHRSPSNSSEPTQTHHHSLLPTVVPTPALVESVAGAAHYSGSNVESDTPLKHRHSSHDRPENHTHLKADHERVLSDIRELYECRPTPELFVRSWHPDAVFEDPLSKCKGFRQYAAQWYAMPKLFSRSETVAFRVMSSTRAPNRIVFTQTQRYKNRFMDKTIESVVTVDLDDKDRITQLVELWDGKPLRVALLRRMAAMVVPLFVHVPRI